MAALAAFFSDPLGQVFPGTFLDYVAVALTSTAVYLFIVIAIRLFGKKELAQLSVTDLVFILLISNAVQNAMVGPNTSLGGGLVAAATLFLVNAAFKGLLKRFPKFGKLVEGEAIMIVHHGIVLKKGMAASGLTSEELMEAIREHGVATIAEVDLAVLEIDGNISVLSAGYKTHSMHKRRGRSRRKNDSQ
jgi:uncharacterized membrane protein YcaP (DUF421 family)